MDRHSHSSTKISSFLHQYKDISFTGGQLGKSLNILEQMFISEDPISIFLALSGALVPAGLQSHLLALLKTNKISGIITTGATLTHDYIEDIGFKHKTIHNFKDDADLRDKGINRILDVGASNKAFEAMEKHLHNWMEEVYAKKSESKTMSISTPDFLQTLGHKLSNNSILGYCARQKIPIFCPAIMDSMLGIHCMTFAEFNKFNLNQIAELKQYVSQCFDTTQTGAIVLGGGVPKNYLFQGMLVSGKELTYAIQVTMDRPEHGGLSGATLDEAISWGKIDPHAKFTTIIADITLVLPIFVAALREIGVLKEL